MSFAIKMIRLPCYLMLLADVIGWLLIFSKAVFFLSQSTHYDCANQQQNMTFGC
jgi:hypothetical protein